MNTVQNCPKRMQHDAVYRSMNRYYPGEPFSLIELWEFGKPIPVHKCQIKFRGKVYQAEEFGTCIRKIEFDHG